MEIRVHIERLILDGLNVPSSQCGLLQAAVQAELAKLLAEGGLSPALQSGGALPSLRAGRVEIAPGAQPAQLGQQIAQAIYGGIGQPGQTTIGKPQGKG